MKIIYSPVKNLKVSEFVSNLSEILNYLGCIPLLAYSSIWYSANKEILESSSQKYHLDHEDYMQVKGFLYLEDISENNGAMNLFSKKSSSKVAKKLNYKTSPNSKRVEDEIFSRYENEKIPFFAHFTFLKKLFVDFPNNLSGL